MDTKQINGPPAAYQVSAGGPLDVNRILYKGLAGRTELREKVQSFVIPIRSGQAWEVKQGQICRIVAVEGPQVADFNAWNLHDPREKFWASRTRQLHSSHVTTFDRLWSTLPFLRPMMTIIGDSLGKYGKDSEGGRVHDLLGTRCDPYVNSMLSGTSFDFNCHSNLVRAIMPYGLTEFDVHDVLNIFQCTGLNEDDKYFMKTCPAKKGDYFEFFAEIDLLCALSTCPSGDQSLPLWGPHSNDDDLVKICRPIGVEVYELKDKSLLKKWRAPEKAFQASYNSVHGLKFPSWGQRQIKNVELKI